MLRSQRGQMASARPLTEIDSSIARIFFLLICPTTNNQLKDGNKMSQTKRIVSDSTTVRQARCSDARGFLL